MTAAVLVSIFHSRRYKKIESCSLLATREKNNFRKNSSDLSSSGYKNHPSESHLHSHQICKGRFSVAAIAASLTASV